MVAQSFPVKRAPAAGFTLFIAAAAFFYAALFAYFIWATAGRMSAYDFLDLVMD